jgi:hypothetical protein
MWSDGFIHFLSSSTKKIPPMAAVSLGFRCDQRVNLRKGPALRVRIAQEGGWTKRAGVGVVD